MTTEQPFQIDTDLLDALEAFSNHQFSPEDKSKLAYRLRTIDDLSDELNMLKEELQERINELEKPLDPVKERLQAVNTVMEKERARIRNSWHPCDLIDRLTVHWGIVPEYATLELEYFTKRTLEGELRQQQKIVDDDKAQVFEEFTPGIEANQEETAKATSEVIFLAEWMAGKDVNTSLFYVTAFPMRAKFVAPVYAEQNAQTDDSFEHYWKRFLESQGNPLVTQKMTLQKYSTLSLSIQAKWEKWLAYEFLSECFELGAISEEPQKP